MGCYQALKVREIELHQLLTHNNCDRQEIYAYIVLGSPMQLRNIIFHRGHIIYLSKLLQDSALVKILVANLTDRGRDMGIEIAIWIFHYISMYIYIHTHIDRTIYPKFLCGFSITHKLSHPFSPFLSQSSDRQHGFTVLSQLSVTDHTGIGTQQSHRKILGRSCSYHPFPTGLSFWPN